MKDQRLTAEMKELLREKGKSDLYFFAKGVLQFDRLNPRIHKPVCRLLELYEGYNDSLARPWREYRRVLLQSFRKRGVERSEWKERLREIKKRGIKRLAILMPRGWFKTTLVSIAYPIWRAVRDPNVRILIAQNTATNARSKGAELGEVILQSSFLRILYPEIIPTPRERWNVDGRCVPRDKAFAEATFEFVGRGTQVTSRHYNVIIEDDTVAPEKEDMGEDNVLPSQVDVSQAIGWHKLVPPLLDQVDKDQNIVVGTRWFEMDLLQWVMTEEKDFIVFMWAAREDERGRPSIQGEPVWKERFSEEVLRNLENSMGPYLFSCLYLNTPIRSDEMTFRPEWIRYYDVEPPTLMTFTTVDLAGDPMDSKGVVDENVVITCGKDMSEGRVYVLDYDAGRYSPSKVIDLIFSHVRKWHPVAVGIESVAYQRSLIHWIRQRQVNENLYFSIQALTNVKQSKEIRIRGLQPLVQNGMLLFRRGMERVISQLLVFPLGRHDDIIDALSMQLQLWRVAPSRREEMKKLEAGIGTMEGAIRMAREAALMMQGTKRIETIFGSFNLEDERRF